MTGIDKILNFFRILLVFIIPPWISGLIYYFCSWTAPIFEGRVESYLTYLYTYQISPFEQILNFTILFYFPFVIFGIPIFLISKKINKYDLKTHILIWALFGIAFGLAFSGLFWRQDDKETFRNTYWVLYSIPISLSVGGMAFWFIGIRKLSGTKAVGL